VQQECGVSAGGRGGAGEGESRSSEAGFPHNSTFLLHSSQRQHYQRAKTKVNLKRPRYRVYYFFFLPGIRNLAACAYTLSPTLYLTTSAKDLDSPLPVRYDRSISINFRTRCDRSIAKFPTCFPHRAPPLTFSTLICMTPRGLQL